MTATQSTPTQTGIVVSLTAGSVKWTHAEGVVVSTAITAGPGGGGGIGLNHAEGIVGSTPITARGNASARRHVLLRRSAITAGMAALLALTPGAALAQSPGGPTVPSLVDESQNVDAPAGPNDRHAPRAALLDAAADLQRTGEGQREAGIARALRPIERAQSAFGDSSRGPELTHLAATTTALADAQRALQSATVSRQTRGKLDAIALRLDGVGRRMASDLLGRATRSDASPRVLLAARASLLSGDLLSAAGRHAAAVGAYGQSVKQSGSGIVFDIARFEQNIRSFFDAQTVGYSYSIARNGVLHSARGFGLARTGADTAGGGTHHDGPQREVNIASVTKTITATAILKLMEKNEIDLDESVAVWLPEQWNLHPSIEDLTFRDLMTQRSGLNESKISTGSTLEELQAAFEKGVVPSDKFFRYQNGNFGVLRVIIAAMLGVDIYGDPGKEPGDVAAETYVTYLQNEVFDQNGTLPDCKPDMQQDLFGGGRTLLYAFSRQRWAGPRPGRLVSAMRRGRPVPVGV